MPSTVSDNWHTWSPIFTTVLSSGIIILHIRKLTSWEVNCSRSHCKPKLKLGFLPDSKVQARSSQNTQRVLMNGLVSLFLALSPHNFNQWLKENEDACLSSSNRTLQFSSVAQLRPTLCDLMNHSMPGLPVHHQLLESTQTHVHWVGDAIQPSHPLSSTSPPALNLSQQKGLFKRVSSSYQVAKILEFQLQHQSFQWTPRTDLL